MSPGTELLLVVAGAQERAAARALDAALVGPAALGAVHGVALAVYAGRVAEHTVADAGGADLAELLEWVEAAPPRVCRVAAVAAEGVLGALRRATAPRRWVPLGAIDRCRAGERAGHRRFGQSDALGRAAVWETVARERHTQGDYVGADEALEYAAEALLAGGPAQGAAGVGEDSRAAMQRAA